jgi:hypothetical protein
MNRKHATGILATAILLVLIGASVHAVGTCDDVPQSGLIGCWPFEETSGNTLRDESVRSNSGALRNGASRTSNGITGRAITLDGVNDFAEITSADFRGTLQNGFSISAWVKADRLPQGQIDDDDQFMGIFDAFNGDTGNSKGEGPRLLIDRSIGYAYAAYGNRGGNIHRIKRFAANTWHHVVLTFEGEKLQFYLDGSQEGFELNLTTPNQGGVNQNAAIGKSGVHSTLETFFDGTIDEVLLYNRALSFSEVRDIRSLSLQGTPACGDGLCNGNETQNSCSKDCGKSCAVGSTIGVSLTQKISDLQGNFSPPLFQNDLFGKSIANVGDLDDDGVNDLVVGAYNDAQGQKKGAIYIILMRANGTVKRAKRISDNTLSVYSGVLPTEDFFGYSVAALGDYDGDGFPDVLVGSKGKVFILYLQGTTVLDFDEFVPNDFSVPFLPTGFWGTAVTTLGDIDGDGFIDIAVSDHADQSGGVNTGAIWIVRLNPGAQIKGVHKISVVSGDGISLFPSNGRAFGKSLAGMGDVDGDGIPDLAVGTQAHGGNGGNQASTIVHILLLNADGTVKSNKHTFNNQLFADLSASLGTEVANVGDIDGDGIPDVLVGIEHNGNTPVRQEGYAVVLFLQADGSLKNRLLIDQSTLPGLSLDARDFFGGGVASLGDLDGDGKTDFIVGAQGDDDGGTTVSEDAGAVYLLETTCSGGGGQGGGGCTNDCSPNGTKQCLNATTTQTCGNFDSDSCLEWGSNTTCSNSGICAGSGVCSGGIEDKGTCAKVPASGLVGCWPFEGTNSNTFSDSSAHWNNGSFENGATRHLEGVVGKSLSLDGINDYAGITNADFLNTLQQGFSFGLWINRDAGSTSTVGLFDQLNGYIHSFERDDGPAAVLTGSSSNLKYHFNNLEKQSTSSIVTNDWAHIMLTYNNGVAKAYKNSVLTDTFNVTIRTQPGDASGSHTDAPPLIGAAFADSNTLQTFNGLIDEVVMYDRQLSDADVKKVYDAAGIPEGTSGSASCGDGVCNGNETQSSCSKDCGSSFTCSGNQEIGVKSFKRISDTAGGLTGTFYNHDAFGSGVSNIGDIDGDGINDVAVGAAGDDQRPANDKGGRVWILRLNANGTVKGATEIADGKSGFTATIDPRDQFGNDVTGIGDLDGDAVPDIVVSAYLDDDGGDRRGAVYVIFLNTNGTVKGHQKISNTQGGWSPPLFQTFGWGLDYYGDQDDDGNADIVVADGGSNYYIIYLNPDGTVKGFSKRSVGILGNNQSVSAIGDVDNDGTIDLAYGIPDTNTKGSVRILLLKPSGTITVVIGENSGGFTGTILPFTSFGRSVSGIGDVDGDGIPDIAVGQALGPGPIASNDFSGVLWILLLKNDGTVKNSFKIQKDSVNFANQLSATNGDGFGSAVDLLGDRDGDGKTDLIVGAHTTDDGGDARGAAYVIHLACVDPPFLCGNNVCETGETINNCRVDCEEQSKIVADCRDILNPIRLDFDNDAWYPSLFEAYISGSPAGQGFPEVNFADGSIDVKAGMIMVNRFPVKVPIWARVLCTSREDSNCKPAGQDNPYGYIKVDEHIRHNPANESSEWTFRCPRACSKNTTPYVTHTGTRVELNASNITDWRIAGQQATNGGDPLYIGGARRTLISKLPDSIIQVNLGLIESFPSGTKVKNVVCVEGVTVCGNGTCETGETAASCRADCGFCGDGACFGTENNSTCSQDCDAVCGNNTCETGETYLNCTSDCPAPDCQNECTADTCRCAPGAGSNPVCGDGTCNGNETAATCSADCGSGGGTGNLGSSCYISSNANNQFERGLLGCWGFESADGIYIAGKAGNNVAIGTVGEPAIVDGRTVFNQQGNAIQLDGRNDALVLSKERRWWHPDPSLDAFSVSMWIKPEDRATRNNALIHSLTGVTSTTDAPYIYLTQNAVRIGLTDPSDTSNEEVFEYVPTEITFKDDRWQHLVITYEGKSPNGVARSRLTGYLDGIASPLGQTLYTEPLINKKDDPITIGGTIGFVGPETGILYKGQIDSVSLWNRALTQDEINEMYNYPYGAGECDGLGFVASLYTGTGPNNKKILIRDSPNLNRWRAGGTIELKNSGNGPVRTSAEIESIEDGGSATQKLLNLKTPMTGSYGNGFIACYKGPLQGSLDEQLFTPLVASFQSSDIVKSFTDISRTDVSPTSKKTAYATSIANVGDIDGDGVNDLVVGSPNNGTDNEGIIHTLLLNANGTLKNFQNISPASQNSLTNRLFGQSVAGMGDMDGDGIPDIAVGARGYWYNGGGVHFLFLKNDGTIKSSIIGIPASGGSTIITRGYAIANAGDIDGDGINDIVVGEQGFVQNQAHTHHAYLYFLNADGTQKSSAAAVRIGGFDALGDIENVGDWDGDGRDEIAVGTPSAVQNSGQVTVYFLNADGSEKKTEVYNKNSNNTFRPGVQNVVSFFGSGIGNVGDFDGDGVYDFAGYIGGPGGTVEIFLLNADGTVRDHETIGWGISNGFTPTKTLIKFGASISNLGDIDGDNKLDIAVGDDWGTSNGAGKETVYILKTTGNVTSSGGGSGGGSCIANSGLKGWENGGRGKTILLEDNGVADTWEVGKEVLLDSTGEGGNIACIDLAPSTAGIRCGVDVLNLGVNQSRALGELTKDMDVVVLDRNLLQGWQFPQIVRYQGCASTGGGGGNECTQYQICATDHDSDVCTEWGTDTGGLCALAACESSIEGAPRKFFAESDGCITFSQVGGSYSTKKCWTVSKIDGFDPSCSSCNLFNPSIPRVDNDAFDEYLLNFSPTNQALIRTACGPTPELSGFKLTNNTTNQQAVVGQSLSAGPQDTIQIDVDLLNDGFQDAVLATSFPNEFLEVDIVKLSIQGFGETTDFDNAYFRDNKNSQLLSNTCNADIDPYSFTTSIPIAGQFCGDKKVKVIATVTDTDGFGTHDIEQEITVSISCQCTEDPDTGRCINLCNDGVDNDNDGQVDDCCPQTTLNDGMIGKWGFEESTVTAQDSSGNGNRGTFQGGAQRTDTGRIGKGLQLNGDGFLEIIDADFEGTLKELSVSLWVKPQTWSTYQGIFQQLANRSRADSRQGISGMVEAGIGPVGDFHWSISNGSSSGDINRFPVNQWTHFVLTMSQSGSLKIYNNNRNYNTPDLFPLDSENGTANPIFGVAVGGPSQIPGFFDGTMDEIMMWDRVITPTEVAQLYAQGNIRCEGGTLAIGNGENGVSCALCNCPQGFQLVNGVCLPPIADLTFPKESIDFTPAAVRDDSIVPQNQRERAVGFVIGAQRENWEYDATTQPSFTTNKKTVHESFDLVKNIANTAGDYLRINYRSQEAGLTRENYLEHLDSFSTRSFEFKTGGQFKQLSDQAYRNIILLGALTDNFPIRFDLLKADGFKANKNDIVISSLDVSKNNNHPTFAENEQNNFTAAWLKVNFTDIPTRAICDNLRCVQVAGVGDDLCGDNESCINNPRHLECEDEACVEFPGVGQNLCQSDAACVKGETKLICQNFACVEVAGSGDDLCQNNAECVNNPRHLECQNNACVEVNGAGDNQCQTDSQCPGDLPTHLACQNNACVEVTGGGSDLCDVDADCIGSRAECVNDACVQVPGEGIDRCTSNGQCDGSTPTHLICQNDACTLVFGPGPDTCSTDVECVAKHMECQNNACTVVPGIAPNTCQSDPQCQATHTICSNNACIEVSGAGKNDCTLGEVCDSTQSHLECVNNACSSVNGPGENVCNTDAACQSGQTRAICQNNACVEVAGTGDDLCQNNAECVNRPMHLECVDNACTEVSGAGNNKCQSNEQCQTSHNACFNNACIEVSGANQNLCQGGNCTNSHLDCRNQACVRVSGTGEDRCQSTSQCLPIGHTICQNNACVLVAGAGENKCSEGSDQCINKRMACVNNACVSVDGSGPNSCSANINCQPGLPDLVLKTFSFDPENPIQVLPFTATVRVCNEGTRDAGEFVVKLDGGTLIDGAFDESFDFPISTKTISSLIVDACQNVTFVNTLSNPGSFAARATADDGRDITEDNETNNKSVLEFMVIDPTKPEVIVESATLAQEVIRPGESTTFTVVWKNDSPLDILAEFTVAYFEKEDTEPAFEDKHWKQEHDVLIPCLLGKGKSGDGSCGKREIEEIIVAAKIRELLETLSHTKSLIVENAEERRICRGVRAIEHQHKKIIEKELEGQLTQEQKDEITTLLEEYARCLEGRSGSSSNGGSNGGGNGGSNGSGSNGGGNNRGVGTSGGNGGLAAEASERILSLGVGAEIPFEGGTATVISFQEGGAAEDTVEVTFQITTDPEVEDQILDVQACGDAGKVLDETNPNNNCGIAQLMVTNKPELRINNLSLSADAVPAGTPVILMLEVNNAGTLEAGAHITAIYQTNCANPLRDQFKVDQFGQSSIAAGASVTYQSFIPTQNLAGRVSHCVIVDTENTVEETSEANNTASFTINILSDDSCEAGDPERCVLDCMEQTGKTAEECCASLPIDQELCLEEIVPELEDPITTADDISLRLIIPRDALVGDNITLGLISVPGNIPVVGGVFSIEEPPASPVETLSLTSNIEGEVEFKVRKAGLHKVIGAKGAARTTGVFVGLTVLTSISGIMSDFVEIGFGQNAQIELVILLVILSLIVLLLGFDKASLLFAPGIKTTRQNRKENVIKTGVGIVVFSLPFIANALSSMSIGIVVAVVEIAVLLLYDYVTTKLLKKRKPIRI